MAVPVFDTLKLARRLREAGLPSEQAEAIAEAEAEALGEFIMADLATKGDIAEIKAEIADLRGDVAELRGELGGTRAELEQKIAESRAELKTDIAQVREEMAVLRSELKTDIAGVKGEIAQPRGEISRFEVVLARMDRKLTLYFALILFAVVFLNQDALAFLARLLGLVR